MVSVGPVLSIEMVPRDGARGGGRNQERYLFLVREGEGKNGAEGADVGPVSIHSLILDRSYSHGISRGHEGPGVSCQVAMRVVRMACLRVRRVVLSRGFVN